MKAQFRKKQSIARGIKLILLTIILQSSVLALALVLKANNMLPADFVNYSGRITKQDSPSDVMMQKASHSKHKVYSYKSVSQSELSAEDQPGESPEFSSIQ